MTTNQGTTQGTTNQGIINQEKGNQAAIAANNAEVNQLAQLSQTSCNLCGRQGFPIYLFRKSVIRRQAGGVNWSNGLPSLAAREAPTGMIAHEYALRHLREGYLYIMVEIDGAKSFLGYEVTPEGAFRYKDLDALLTDKIEPLAPSCTAQNHLIPGSFINLDDKVEKAWFAFTRRPWSKAVRDRYSTGQADLSRFSAITLNAAAKAKCPDGVVPLAQIVDKANTMAFRNDLTYQKDNGTPVIAEFAVESLQGNLHFHSAHAFTSRKNQLALYQRYINSVESAQLQIPAIIVEDNFAIVEELNYQRAVNCNFTGQSAQNGKIDDSTKLPYVYHPSLSEEYLHKAGIASLFDNYQDALTQYYKNNSVSKIVRKEGIGEGHTQTIEQRDIDPTTPNIRYGLNYISQRISQQQSAASNFAAEWQKYQKQLKNSGEDWQQFKLKSQRLEQEKQTIIRKFSFDYAFYARWFFIDYQTTQPSALVEDQGLASWNLTPFWQVEFDYSSDEMHAEYLKDAYDALGGSIAVTDYVRALRDEIVSNPDSFYYQVIAGGDATFWQDDPQDGSASSANNAADSQAASSNATTAVNTSVTGVTPAPAPKSGIDSKTTVDIAKEIATPPLAKLNDYSLLESLIIDFRRALSLDVMVGLAEYSSENGGKVLLDDVIFKKNITLLSKKIGHGAVFSQDVYLRVRNINSFYESLRLLSVSGHVDGFGIQGEVTDSKGRQQILKNDGTAYVKLGTAAAMKQMSAINGMGREGNTVVKLNLSFALEDVYAGLGQRITNLLAETSLSAPLKLVKFRNMVATLPSNSIQLTAWIESSPELMAKTRALKITPTEYAGQVQRTWSAFSSKLFLNSIMAMLQIQALQTNLAELKKQNLTPEARGAVLFSITTATIALASMAAEAVGMGIQYATSSPTAAFSRITDILKSNPTKINQLPIDKYQLLAKAKGINQVGASMAKLGGRVLAIIGIVDGGLNIIKSIDLFVKQDFISGYLNIFGGGLTIIGSLAALGIFGLSTPVGITIALLGIALIVIAAYFERSDLQRWFAGSCFGRDTAQYPLTLAGLTQACQQFKALVSGMDVRLVLMEPGQYNQEKIDYGYDDASLGGQTATSIMRLNAPSANFHYTSLYLYIRIPNFALATDQLTAHIQLLDQRGKPLATLRYHHKQGTLSGEATLINTTLSQQQLVPYNENLAHSTFYHYQCDKATIDNSNPGMKEVSPDDAPTVLNVSFKLAEVLKSAISSMHLVLLYQRPDDQQVAEPLQFNYTSRVTTL